jgi:hypothetical protein
VVNHGKSLGKGIAAGAAAKVTYRLGDTVSTTQMNTSRAIASWSRMANWC